MRTGGLRPNGRTRDLPVPRDKERLHMPGSTTTPGHLDTRSCRAHACCLPPTERRRRPSCGTFAAQWLAYALRYRRFAYTLAGACARLGADADRYSFIVADFHRLLLA